MLGEERWRELRTLAGVGPGPLLGLWPGPPTHPQPWKLQAAPPPCVPKPYSGAEVE